MSFRYASSSSGGAAKGTGTPRRSPADTGSQQRFSNNELQAENQQLKARVTTLTEELRITREICNKNQKTAQGSTPSRRTPERGRTATTGERGKSTEILSFVPCIEASVQTADVREAEDTQDEVRQLKAKLARSNTECASLQQELHVLQGTMLGATDDRQREQNEEIVRLAALLKAAEQGKRQQGQTIEVLKSDLQRANDTIESKEQRIRTLLQTASDRESEPSPRTSSKLPTVVISDSSVEQRLRDELETLQKTHELTRMQLQQVRSELLRQQSKGDFSAASEGVRSALIPRPTTENVGVQVTSNTHYECEKLFKIYNKSFDPTTVEGLLLSAERAEERKAHAQQSAASHAEDVQHLKKELESTQQEVVDAHEKINELHYALDIERREKNQQRVMNMMGGGGGSAEDGNRHYQANQAAALKQATTEISFLCDTLAGTRKELEYSERRLKETEAERDAAVASFNDLKERTQEMFEGCQRIAEATRKDADESISALATSLRQKESQLHSAKGQLAALHRDMESREHTYTSSRDSMKKELDTTKGKVARLTATLSRLKEDNHAQAAALKEAEGKSEAASSKRRSRSAGTDVRSNGSFQRAPSSSSAAPRANPVGRSTSVGGASAAPSKSGDTGTPTPLQEEYEELRSCFLMLVPLIPQAETAREVATGVCAGVEKLNERIALLEKEIKKKTVVLQATKKDLQASEEAIAGLERRVSQVPELSKRIDAKEQQVDKAKRINEAQRKEAEKMRKELEEKIVALKREVKETKAALSQAKSEIGEGRDLMMRLLAEDEAAINAEEYLNRSSPS